MKVGATAINGEPNYGSLDKTPPREVFLNRKMDVKKDARVKIGTHVQVEKKEKTKS